MKKKKIKIYSKAELHKLISAVGDSCILVLAMHEDDFGEGIDVRIGDVDDDYWEDGEEKDLIKFYSDFILQAMDETPEFRKIIDRVIDETVARRKAGAK